MRTPARHQCHQHLSNALNIDLRGARGNNVSNSFLRFCLKNTSSSSSPVDGDKIARDCEDWEQ